MSNWNRLFPNLTDARANISGFARDGKNHGALGLFNTFWLDDGESMLGMAWYGVLFGAAAAWQAGEVTAEQFDGAYDWAFYRADGDAFTKINYRLDSVHALFRSRDVWDALDEVFWTDPFSRTGAPKMRRLLPIASGVRRAAEQTLIDIGRHAASARLHVETLPYLRLAAKRLDYTGMKIRYANEIADLYRDTQAHPEDSRRFILNHIQVSSVNTNGRVEDLRDGATELRTLYRDVWLMHHTPYYLDNVLVRFDHEALYWHRMSRLFAEVRERYNAEKKVPPPEEIGLCLP